MKAARALEAAGGALCVAAVLSQPPYTALSLLGLALLVAGWARGETQRMRQKIEQGRRDRLLGRDYPLNRGGGRPWL